MATLALQQAQQPVEPTLTVLLSLAIAVLAYRTVAALVPFLANDLVSKGLRGRDMLKPGFKRDDETPAVDDGAGGGVVDEPGTQWL